MSIWIALLRGINVGGRHRLPMAQLRDCAESLGWADVRTYIQSGNCVFTASVPDSTKSAAALAQALTEAVERVAGFAPTVLVRSIAEFEDAVARNPYPAGDEDPKSVHLFFLERATSDANLDALEALRQGREAFTLVDRVFYLFAPEGIGRSKLAEKVERHVPVPMTARNLRSARRILELAHAVRDGAV